MASDENSDRGQKDSEATHARTTQTLAGRTVLVTGGAHRVGGAISRHLGSLGARVLVAHHRSPEAAETLVAELPAGGRAFAIDLTNPAGADDLLAGCAAADDLPDAIIHSAASFLHRGLLDTSAEEWDRVFALNTRAFFLLAKSFAVHHGIGGEVAGGGEGGAASETRSGGLPSGEAGEPEDLSLVAVSDSGALELWPGYAAHCVSKAALEPLIKVLAKTLAPRVRVNAVMPGPVLPPPGTSPALQAEMSQRTLLRRLGDPADIAGAVAFLLTNRYTTGSTVQVTGGAHLWRGKLDRL